MNDTSSKTSPPAFPPLRRLLGILRPDRGDLWAVVVFALVVGGLLLATPIAVQALVNFVAFGGAKTPILVLSLLLACGLGLAGLLSAVQTWIVEILQRRLFVRTVADVAHRLPRIDARRHDSGYGPELVNRFFDVVTVQKTTAYLLLDGLGVVLGVFIGMLVLAFYHPILLAFDMVIVLAVAAIVFGLGRTGVRTAIVESKAKYAMVAWLEEVARQRTAFRHPDARSFLTCRADDLASNYITSRKAHYRVLFRQILGALGLQAAASVALLGVGGLLVVRGELTLGQLVAAELIVTWVVGSVAKMGKHFEAYYDLMAATDKLGQLFDVELESVGRETWSRTGKRGGMTVAAGDVVLRLPTGRQLFEGLSFQVGAGECVALTGPSGSGKTLLLETLYGLRRTDGGSVRLDDLDVRTLDIDTLRAQVAFAGAPEMFEGTVYDNLTLGRDIPAEALQDALRRAEVLETILSLSDGLDTRMQADGRPFSSGQLARLTLARAIAGSPSLLLVDGLLDALTEKDAARVLASLRSSDAPCTLIVATRRPAVARCCDRTLGVEPRPMEAVR